MNFDGYDLCFGGSGGSVPVVSLVPVVPFRWLRSLRWFRWFRSGGFVPLFRVLPHAGLCPIHFTVTFVGLAKDC